MYISLDVGLKFRDIFRTKKSLPYEGNIFLTDNARTSLGLLLNSLAKNEEINIYVPSLICKSALELISSDVRIIFYNVNHNLSIDIDVIKKYSIKKQCILLVHYFGSPIKNFEYVLDFCKRHDILIIEDCAHCFGGKYKNKYLGTFGDFAIFSLKKFFPIISGGLLLIKQNTVLIDETTLLKKRIKYLLIIKKFLKTNSIIKLFPIKLKEKNNFKTQQSSSAKLYNMDNLCEYIFYSQNIEIISNKRKNNFLFYLNEFKSLNINLIQKIENNFCPWTFPVIIKENCKILYKMLIASGISCEIWDSLPECVISARKFSEVKKFAQSILLLPVHQNMTKRELRFVSRKVREFCEKEK